MEKAARMSSIPGEIYREILLRLPVKSLLVCKSVCKNWYALISTSDFVKTHIAIQEKKPNLMLEGSDRRNGNRMPYSIAYDSLVSFSIVVEADPIDAIEMDYPFKSIGYKTVQLLGSSNGLICMRLFDLDHFKSLLCLWNPATKEYKELPKLPVEFCDYDVQFHAFGYDHKTDDYKLAIGLKALGSSVGNQVQVYMLASDSWKAGKTIPYRFSYYQRSGVIFNGALHWLPLGQDNYVLLYLDISGETFEEIQLPKELMEENMNRYMFLGVLEGCLCILVSSDVNDRFEVWEMLDYGVRESWTKRYVIAHESIIDYQHYFRLVLSFKNWMILFLNGTGIVLYDLKNGSGRELKFNSNLFLDSKSTKNYFESLVSLNSGTYVGEEDN